MKLDRIDLDIISLLVENSRLSVTEIANRLGISRPTVRERIKRMINEGIIKKFTVVLDDSLFKELTVIFQFKPNNLDRLIERLKNKPEITQLYLVSGGETLFGIGKYESLDRLKEDVYEMFESGENFSFYIVLKKLKDEIFIPVLAFNINCDYCGKEITENPIKYTLYNRNFYFCCKTCLSNFRKAREIEKK